MRLNDSIILDSGGKRLFSIANNVDFGFGNPKSEMVIESPAIIINNSRIDCGFIGAYCFINENVTIRHTERIGRFSSIAPDAYIGLVDHPIDSLSSSDYFFGRLKWNFCDNKYRYTDTFNVNYKSKIVIGNDVWIGMRAMVMRGVKIADGTIIAAGSVVTHDTEPYEIVGGVPARHIRYRFESEVIDALMSSRWWDYDVGVWNDKKISKATVELVRSVDSNAPRMNPLKIKVIPSENRYEFIE